MRVVKLKTKYKVYSESDKTRFYWVDLKNKTCTCPEYMFRMRKIGGICKHINAAEERASGKKLPSVITREEKEQRKKHAKELGRHDKEVDEKNKKYEEIAAFVREKGSVESVELMEKFGEEYVEDMIRLGELFEEQGMIRVLE